MTGRIVIILDGAANYLYSINLMPNIIFGDFDSIEENILYHCVNQGVRLIYQPDQNYTDLEKSIDYCDQLQAKSIVLINVLAGNRSDHTLAAFSSLKRYYNPARRLIIAAADVIESIRHQQIYLLGTPQQQLSVIGFPQAYVSSSGLKWEMNNINCTLGDNDSFSNEFVSTEVSLKIDGEAIVVYPFSADPMILF